MLGNFVKSPELNDFFPDFDKLDKLDELELEFVFLRFAPLKLSELLLELEDFPEFFLPCDFFDFFLFISFSSSFLSSFIELFITSGFISSTFILIFFSSFLSISLSK